MTSIEVGSSAVASTASGPAWLRRIGGIKKKKKRQGGISTKDKEEK
jgi:hypothetical protein